MITEIIFAVGVGIENELLSEKEKDVVLNSIYKIKENNVDFKKANWLTTDQPYNTFMNNGSILKNESLKFFVDRVSKKVKEYAIKTYNDNSTLTCPHAWFNIYTGDNYQEPHAHAYPNLYSAVYFPLAPEGAGEIIFQSPIPHYAPEHKTTSITVFNSSVHRYKPKDNMLIIFRSDLQHYVLPGTNSSDRISIAFNFCPSPDDYNSYVSEKMINE